MGRNNEMQERQDKVKMEIIVHGVQDWKECLAVPIKLGELFAKLCGRAEVPYMTYTRKQAEVNCHSFERSVVIAFFVLGYQLEELEVDIDGKEEWGKCVWYKEHPAYSQPIDEMWGGSIINNPAFYYAMFKTEHVGDQYWSIYSTQFSTDNSVLPHKTLIYRKIVFSPPKPKEAATV